MADLLQDVELTGLRADVDLILGIDADGNDNGQTQIKVQRPDDMPSFDTTTGLYTYDHITIYEGAAYVFPVVFRRSRQETVNEEMERIRIYRALLPWDAGDIYLEDIVTITDSADTRFVGRTMRVVDVMYESDQALRRIDLVDSEDDGQGEY